MSNNRKDGHKLTIPILIQPNIGLGSDVRYSVVVILNRTLANEAVLTQKTRSAYWNLSGDGFSERQTLFKTQFHLLNTISDEVAERIRILGGLVIGSLKEFIDYTRLEEQPGGTPGLMRLLADHESAIRYLRADATSCGNEYEDEGSLDLLVSILRMHEKMAWMLRSHIEPLLHEAKLSEAAGAII